MLVMMGVVAWSGTHSSNLAENSKILKFQKKRLGFPWAWLALGGRKRVPWLLATFRDFESPEYVPRTSARAHMCTAVFMRAPCVPRNREHEKRSAGERAKNAYVQKKSIWYIVICQKGENQRRGLSGYKKNERQGRTWSTDATSTYSNIRRAE